MKKDFIFIPKIKRRYIKNPKKKEFIKEEEIYNIHEEYCKLNSLSESG